MPTKPIEQLLFAQGGRCFFCQRVLTSGDASIEHLVASSNGGGNHPDNCVACCQALNSLLGSMSLKEKLRIFLNQKGEFKCPNVGAVTVKPRAQQTPVLKPRTQQTPVLKPRAPQTPPQRLALVVSDLRKRGTARPRTLNTLGRTISALFQKQITEHEVTSLLAKLKAQGVISVSGTRVTYVLPPGVA